MAIARSTRNTKRARIPKLNWFIFASRLRRRAFPSPRLRSPEAGGAQQGHEAGRVLSSGEQCGSPQCTCVRVWALSHAPPGLSEGTSGTPELTFHKLGTVGQATLKGSQLGSLERREQCSSKIREGNQTWTSLPCCTIHPFSVADRCFSVTIDMEDVVTRTFELSGGAFDLSFTRSLLGKTVIRPVARKCC